MITQFAYLLRQSQNADQRDLVLHQTLRSFTLLELMLRHPASIHQHRIVSIGQLERRDDPGAVLQIAATEQAASRLALIQSGSRLYDDLFRMIEFALQNEPIVLPVGQHSEAVREAGD